MTLLIFLLILSILVLVHELGHFIVAKLSGVRVEEFGIGFPPKIISIKRGETVYSVNALLFGGFVRLYGEEEALDKERADSARMFRAKSKKIRAAIITAGVIMNFVLATVAFSILYSIVGIPRSTDTVRIVEVIEHSPAGSAGLKTEDVILTVDGNNVTSADEFITKVGDKKGKEVELLIRGDGQERTITLTPREDPPQGEGPLGVAITDRVQYFPPIWQRPFWGAYYGFQEAFLWGKQTITGLGILFGTLFTQRSIPEGIAGPVGIFQITGAVSQQGVLALLHFLGVLSVNLGILNILPFPALDGGRLLFVGIEAVFRGRARAIIPRLERLTNMVGFVLLVALLVAITFQDLRRLLGG